MKVSYMPTKEQCIEILQAQLVSLKKDIFDTSQVAHILVSKFEQRDYSEALSYSKELQYLLLGLLKKHLNVHNELTLY